MAFQSNLLGLLVIISTITTTVSQRSFTIRTKSNITRKGIPVGFSLNTNDVYNDPDNQYPLGGNLTASGKVLGEKELSKNTLDEKCASGLPLSVTWQYYGPYARPLNEHEQKSFSHGVGVGGIFPHLVNKMLRMCCNPKTRVTQGKIINSIQKLESELENPDTAYDMTFPITGVSIDDTTFKDMIFIPIVEAPRIALLVMDKEGAEKTSQLLQTVTKAWPILVFILVAATLSGIIIWALVSTNKLQLHLFWPLRFAVIVDDDPDD